MARKRGGIAGLWDRNKNFIRPAAELAAGAFGGPWAGAAAGAAMRGLDRPGKSGIGFDFGQGVRGGLEGYSLGNLGKFGADKLGSMFGSAPTVSAGTPALQGGVTLPKADGTFTVPKLSVPGLPSTAALPSEVGFDAALSPDAWKTAGFSFAQAPASAPSLTPEIIQKAIAGTSPRAPVGTAPNVLAPTVPPPKPSKLDFLKNNQYLLGSLFSSLAGQKSDDAKAEYTKMQTAMLRKQMELEEEARQNAQAKSDLLAKLLVGGFYGRPTVTI